MHYIKKNSFIYKMKTIIINDVKFGYSSYEELLQIIDMNSDVIIERNLSCGNNFKNSR